MYVWNSNYGGGVSVFCDNNSMYSNASFSESSLKKKHNAICFHRVRECVAAGIMIVHKVDSEFNLSDVLTKCLAAEPRKSCLNTLCLQKFEMRRKLYPDEYHLRGVSVTHCLITHDRLSIGKNDACKPL